MKGKAGPAESSCPAQTDRVPRPGPWGASVLEGDIIPSRFESLQAVIRV